MNKKLLFAATMAAMLASCSSEDALQSSKNLPDTAGIENAVSFDAYTQRGLTRSGDAGVMDNDKLGTTGFGVFGYYTDMNMYEPTAIPNFMYNQQVTKSGGSWTYEPVKYWPNEYGNKAQSDDVDQLSFFAYAPYVANTPATGKVTDETVGITGFTRNTAQGDPIVKYIGSLDPTKCVDLCWGVCAAADATWNIIQGGSQTMTAGLPWLNVQRPQKSLGQKVKFTFKHALAQLNVQIDADVNTNAHGEGSELDANTKVFVRKVTFSGFAMKGALNLNNEVADQPQWVDYSCGCNDPIQSEEYTIYDGMKDGKEGTGYVAGNEKVTGLNPTLIQSKKWSEQAATDGVQKEAKNLFNAASADASIYVIPTGDEMNITIEYDIETKSDNLAGTVSDNETAGISIPNTITKTITLSGDATQKMILEAGKKHTIKLHLGLSTIEFDADVEPWDESQGAAEAWFPANGPGVVLPTSVSISGADALAANNYSGQLSVDVLPAEATDKSVTWSSSNPNLLAVDANGYVSLASADALNGIDINGEDVTITATSNADGNVKDTKIITVKPALGMFIASDGKAYTTQTGDAKAWIAAEGLAIALTYDSNLGNSNISWNDFKSRTNDFATGPAEANISGGEWRWPNKADLNVIDASINAGNYQGCPLEAGYLYWSTEEVGTTNAWYLKFNGNSSLVINYGKGNSNGNRVRAVFAY